MKAIFTGVLPAVLALGSLPAAVADTAAPSTGSITHADVSKWADAWNSHDIDVVMALFASNVQIDQPENPKPLDYAHTRGFFSMIFRAYPDFHVEVKQAIVEGTSAVSVERVTGTWKGPFVNPATGESTPGNGRSFDHPGVMVLEYGPDHKITHVSMLLGSVDGG